jgi:MFS family permease
LLLAFCRGLLIPILPLYAASFGVSYGLIGLAVAAEGVGTLFGDLPAGILLGRMGQKRAMLAGITCIALSMLAMGWAQSFPQLVLFGLVSGAGGALWNISRHAYIADVTPLHRRGRAIAVFGGINRIGVFAGPVVGGAIGAAYGLRFPFILYAGLAAVAILFPALFGQELTGAIAHRRGGLRGHSVHLWALVRAHFTVLLSAGSGQVFAQMIRSGRQIIVPLFAADVLGLDVQSIGWIVSLAAAIDMSMFYPAGLIMDRLGRKYAYVPSFLIQALGMALIPFSSGFLGLLLATSVLGLGNGIGSGTMMTLGADLAPEGAMGEFLGVWRLIGDAGQTSGPVIVGSVADLLGLSAATFVLAGIGLMAATMLGLLVPETLRTGTQKSKAGA